MLTKPNKILDQLRVTHSGLHKTWPGDWPMFELTGLFDSSGDDNFYELLEAKASPDQSKAIKLAKKALKDNPYNVNANLIILRYEKNVEGILQSLEPLVKKWKKQVEHVRRIYRNNEYDFLLSATVRNYLMLLYHYSLVLSKLENYEDAINICKEMLSLSFEGIDYFSTEYRLIGLYTKLSKLKGAKEYFIESSFDYKRSKFPMAYLHFKLGNKETASRLIEELEKDYKGYCEDIIELFPIYQAIEDFTDDWVSRDDTREHGFFKWSFNANPTEQIQELDKGYYLYSYYFFYDLPFLQNEVHEFIEWLKERV